MFKKGQTVVLIKMWNKATAYAQTCTVKSWGKQQGTLELVSNGKMIEERIYTTKLGTWFTVCTPEDAESVAMQFATENYNREVRSCETCLSNPHDAYQNPYYRKSIQDKLDELKSQAPSVISK